MAKKKDGPTPSEIYWRNREAEQRKKDITDQMAYNREVRRIYQQMLDNIQKEIDAFYGKYAQKEGITLAEAKRRVSAIDFEAYERKAKQYVRAARKDRKQRTDKRAGYYFSDQANEEMRLYNLTMKVNRLELLKANIGLELVDGFDRLNETFDEKLTRHATNEFTRLAGILGDSVRNNPQYVHAIVNASFHNATYSDRIWTHQDTLKAALDRQIQIGLIQGKSSTELARAIRQEFGVSRKNAERLMLTEMRRVRTEVARISYEENGTREYQFLALGGNPCDVCADIDGKVFLVKDMAPGANAPPMHPNCLCCTAPYWDEEKFQRWLDSGAAADGVPWAEFEAEQNSVENGTDSGIMKSGAVGGALDPNSNRAQEHADRYYESVRNMTIDHIRIAENTGYSQEEIKSVKDFVFNTKHDLGDGERRYFDASYEMAESWQRLIDGKDIQSHDLTLIRHELMEKDLMQSGMSQAEAHIQASKKYNYAKEAKAYYGRTRKNQKE